MVSHPQPKFRGKLEVKFPCGPHQIESQESCTKILIDFAALFQNQNMNLIMWRLQPHCCVVVDCGLFVFCTAVQTQGSVIINTLCEGFCSVCLCFYFDRNSVLLPHSLEVTVWRLSV